MTNIMERIKIGTSVRLRPVIMTASVASLGFLPMALSTSAGAEVQKPLATVVIGGLITATLLTLIILPILYYYLEKASERKSGARSIAGVLFILMFSNVGNGQITNVDQAIETALENNKSIEASTLRIKQSEQLIDGAYIIPKTDFGASLGQINTKAFDMNFSISQRFNPFVRNVKKALARDKYTKNEIAYELAKQDLILEVRQTWDLLQYRLASLELLNDQLVYWKNFSAHAARKFEVGESNTIEKSTAEIKFNSIQQKILLLQTDIENLYMQLGSLLYSDQNIVVDFIDYDKIELPELTDAQLLQMHPTLQLALQDIKIAESRAGSLKADKKPEVTAGYFIQSIKGAQEFDGVVTNYNGVPRFQGVNLGMSIPLFGGGYNAQIRAAETAKLVNEAEYEQQLKQTEYFFTSTVNRINILQSNLEYFEQTGLDEAKSIAENSQLLYQRGEIGYFEYAQALLSNNEVRQAYIDLLHEYNHLANQLLYLQNK